MRKKNLKYYVQTSLLKANAFMYKLFYKSRSAELHRLQKQYLSAFEKHTFNFNASIEELLPFYTYGYFQKRSDLEKAILLDEHGVCFSAVNSPYQAYLNPLFPSYFGLVAFNEYLKDDSSKSLDVFWTQVEALKAHGNFEDSNFILFIPFDYPRFNLKTPWMAGITQALAASMFFRACYLKPNEGFEKYYKATIDSLYKATSDNGVFCKTPEGNDWMEEYPSPSPSYVLNGFIFCVIAVTEYAIFSNDDLYKTKAIRLYKSLLASLAEYRIDKHWRYDRYFWKFSNIEYQALHTFQFLHLYKLSEMEIFKTISLECNEAMDWENFFYFYQMPKRSIQISDYL